MTGTGPPSGDAEHGETLGAYLKRLRRGLGLSLRGVEEASGKAVANGYLSQVESGSIQRPAPNVLYRLAEVYGVDYADLLARAGHHVPAERATGGGGTVAGLPLRALEDLTEGEKAQLLQYVAFLRSQRPAAGGRP